MHHLLYITVIVLVAGLVRCKTNDLMCRHVNKLESVSTITIIEENITERKDYAKYDNTKIYKYNTELEKMVNLQIKIEMNAFYNYLSMAQFFKRYDQERAGFAKYFRASASEELEHAEAFMKYQQMRGGLVELHEIPAPGKNKWKNGRDVFMAAFELEKSVTDQVLCLHAFAVDKFKDTDFVNFLEEKVIPEQYQSMKEIKTHIKSLERACAGTSETWKVCDAYPLYEMQYDQTMMK